MKVVMVGPFGLRPQGTMARRALPLARTLVVHGHDVAMVLPPWGCPEDSGQQWEEDGVWICNIVLPRSIPLLEEIIIAWRLVRRALQAQPDVFHCFKPKAYSRLTAAVVWCLAKMRLTKVRVALDSDDWEGWGGWNELGSYSAIQKRFFAWQERWGMTDCHALTVASRTLEKSVPWSWELTGAYCTTCPTVPTLSLKLRTRARGTRFEKSGSLVRTQ